MIRRLQRRFILIATAAVVILLMLVLGTINLVNLRRANQESREILQLLADNDGSIPDDGIYHKKADILDMNPELSFQVRYFSAKVSADGEIVYLDTNHIAAISQEEAAEFARAMAKQGTPEGFVRDDGGIYRYLLTSRDDGGWLVVMMDCNRIYQSVVLFQQYSLFYGGVCTLLYVLILTFLSGRVIRPFVRNMENQKQFITNAGHELKTPLAVISANTEVLEMTTGANEWTRSIMNQVKRMSGLVGNLITLSRLGEREDVVISQVDMSAQTADVLEGFGAVAAQQGKKLESAVADRVTVRAEARYLHELVTILVDNAVKYCDDGGSVQVRLEPRNRGKGITGARLTISNNYMAGKGMDYERFFDRFYREDSSHNNEKSGYGIGLAMAREITDLFHGHIHAGWRDGRISFTVVL